jgi:hypothetical protein
LRTPKTGSWSPRLRPGRSLLNVLTAVRPIALALAAWFGVLLAAWGARADGLTPAEADRLARAETVVRTESIERNGRRYVGGVAYAILDTSPADLEALLVNDEAWRRIMPKARSACRVGTEGGDALVEMTHGTPLLQATYTIRVRREAHNVRFWLDPRRPHDIEDAWGFLRAVPRPDGRTLVTYGVLIDMGPGLLRDLFEERVRAVALTVPDRVRDLLLERSATSVRASR